jgi:hypothetical protein
MLEGRGSCAMKYIILAAFAVLITSAGVLNAQTASKAAKAAAPPRKNLFVGSDTPGLLPLNKITPTADELEIAAQKLSGRLRNQDPFDLATFPSEEAVQPVLDDELPRATVRITLNQALQTLKINGVNLVGKEFLIGGRNAFEGDVIELSFKGELFQAEVMEVAATQIVFRDLQRNETGVLSHKAVPNLSIEPMKSRASPLIDKMTPMETSPSGKK